MVPLLSLGSDQVKNALRVDKDICAYHCDELRGEDGRFLRQILMDMSDSECHENSTILFMSPQSLPPIFMQRQA